MNELTLFKNEKLGEVRTAVEKDKIYFNLSDVCKILEIENHGNVKNRLIEKGVRTMDTLTNGGMQPMIYIDEANLYKTIFQSRKPEAESFTEWVTGEILPSIRKHGMYAISDLLDNPDLVIEALTKLKIEREQRKQLENKVSILEPKAEYYDNILVPNHVFAIKHIAKDLGTTSNNLNKILEKLKIQYNPKVKYMPWTLYSKYDWLIPIYCDYVDYKNEYMSTPSKHLQWSQRGREWLIETLDQAGCVTWYDGKPRLKKQA